MKKLTIPDVETVILALQDEIRRSRESRYDHRLHGILLIAQGMSGGQVAQLLGDAPRTVAYWVRRFEQEGLAGLTGSALGVRQCQRIFRQLGFRLRKPRPQIARADPREQARFKKTPETGEGSAD